MLGKFMLVEDTIPALKHRVTECGALEFTDAKGDRVMTIPPGAWLLCEPAGREVTFSVPAVGPDEQPAGEGSGPNEPPTPDGQPLIIPGA